MLSLLLIGAVAETMVRVFFFLPPFETEELLGFHSKDTSAQLTCRFDRSPSSIIVGSPATSLTKCNPQKKKNAASIENSIRKPKKKEKKKRTKIFRSFQRIVDGREKRRRCKSSRDYMPLLRLHHCWRSPTLSLHFPAWDRILQLVLPSRNRSGSDPLGLLAVCLPLHLL